MPAELKDMDNFEGIQEIQFYVIEDMERKIPKNLKYDNTTNCKEIEF